MRLVVDASVAVKWYLPERPDEQDVAQAEAIGRALGRGEHRLFTPPHWVMEVVAVLARTEPEMIDEALAELSGFGPVVVGELHVLKRAADLSVKLGHHLFDTLYHAVALETGATLVTADESYLRKAAGEGSIMRLADFPRQ